MQVLYVHAAPVEAGQLREVYDDVEFLEVGIGKAASTFALTDRLARSEAPGLVVNFGVCGSYAPPIDVLDLCVVSEDCLADEGVQTETGFLDLGVSGPVTMDAARTDEMRELLDRPIVAKGATVSTCSGTDALAAAIAARTGAQIETMEGAAIARVCQRTNIPVVQLRCVSNRTGDRERGGWDLDGACLRVQAAVRRLIDCGWRP